MSIPCESNEGPPMSSTTRNKRIVIIGGGHAGFEVCAKLRNLGVTDPISLISAEDFMPYQRPPLSKAYLLGEMSVDKLYFVQRHFTKLKISMCISGHAVLGLTVRRKLSRSQMRRALGTGPWSLQQVQRRSCCQALWVVI